MSPSRESCPRADAGPRSDRAPALSGEAKSGTTSAGIFHEVSGQGEPVVHIHAFSVDRRMWEPQIQALEGRFTVIRYDLRGHGKSEPPSAPYSPVEDLVSVLDAAGVTRATLVGLSAGAEIATDTALARPERVARLVLVGDKELPHILDVAGILEAGIPRAKKRVIPGAGHILNLEAREEFDRELLAFLAGP